MTKTLLAALAFCAVLAAPLSAQESGDGQDETGQAPLRPAKIETVQPGDGTLRRQFFGRVSAKETVNLAFQVGGQIVELPVVEGRFLDEGELVGKLDLESFELAVERAEVELADARGDRERLENLGRETVTEVNIEDARTAEQLAEIQLQEARDQLEDATLHAPFDALVVRRLEAKFSTVSAGTPVVRLHDMSELQVDIEVPEVLFQRVQDEPNVQFSATFPGGPGAYPLEIREFEAETADVGQTYTLTLAFTEEPEDWLLPGASARVEAVVDSGMDGPIFVPETALIFTPDRDPAVMVFEPAEGDTGTVRRKTVEVEATHDGRFRVVSGLQAGTPIVVAGASQLRDGQTVRRYAGVEG